MPTPSDEEYATTADLAEFVHDRLIADEGQSPGIDVLRSLFRAMYAASMATEEGQAITFDLVWIDPNNPDPDPPQVPVPGRWTTVPLASRIPLTTRALIKASKATDPRTSSFAVCSSDSGQTYIWGMVDQGNRSYDFRRFDSEWTFDSPGLFQASTLGIGHLEVSIRLHLVAELRIDKLLTTSLDPLEFGPVLEALRLGIEHYLEAIRAVVPPKISTDHPDWILSLGSLWLATLARVLLRIRGMGHGGALLITPETTKTGLDVKYEIAYRRLPEALRRWGQAIVSRSDAISSVRNVLSSDAPAIDGELYRRERGSRSQAEDAESEIDGALWFIACLSRIDGLILMSQDLSVTGYGTIITIEDAPKVVYAAVDNNPDAEHRKPLSYDAFGTRHRSMMRYCDFFPGSIGFVISQDGDIRAMTKVGDNLVVWDGIRLHR